MLDIMIVKGAKDQLNEVFYIQISFKIDDRIDHYYSKLLLE